MLSPVGSRLFLADSGTSLHSKIRADGENMTCAFPVAMATGAENAEMLDILGTDVLTEQLLPSLACTGACVCVRESAPVD